MGRLFGCYSYIRILVVGWSRFRMLLGDMSVTQFLAVGHIANLLGCFEFKFVMSETQQVCFQFLTN